MKEITAEVMQVARPEVPEPEGGIVLHWSVPDRHWMYGGGQFLPTLEKAAEQIGWHSESAVLRLVRIGPARVADPDAREGESCVHGIALGCVQCGRDAVDAVHNLTEEIFKRDATIAAQAAEIERLKNQLRTTDDHCAVAVQIEKDTIKEVVKVCEEQERTIAAQKAEIKRLQSQVRYGAEMADESARTIAALREQIAALRELVQHCDGSCQCSAPEPCIHRTNELYDLSGRTSSGSWIEPTPAPMVGDVKIISDKAAIYSGRREEPTHAPKKYDHDERGWEPPK